MKKISFDFSWFVVILIVSITCILATIGIIREKIEIENSSKVFVLVYEDLKNDIDIYAHVDTKVMYMCDSTRKTRVFEIMLDEFGKPLIYQGDL